MASMFSLLKYIHDDSSSWACNLRVIRTYQVPEFGSPNQPKSLEVIFHDSDGDRIHATIRRELMGDYVTFLREGHLYHVENFVVADNRMKYKTTLHRKKIIFIKKTIVNVHSDKTFPYFMYNFRSFSDICASEDSDNSVLFDVIGSVVSMKPPENKVVNGRPTRLMDFVLEDAEQRQMMGTMWGDEIDQLSSCANVGGLNPDVVIIQFCRATFYRGEAKICNTFHVTKLIMDKEIDKIIEFKIRLLNTKRQGIGGICRVNNAPNYSPQQKRSFIVKSVIKLRQLDILESLVNKMVLFKVQVRADQIENFEYSYTVMKVTTDPNLISKYSGLYFDSQDR
ncbi:hypothetical protein C2S52_019870 [Perilla frutescens var. hirtella]|nr:hypothetical protein C2S52_019870 [Perilla frutescens var. hirtella]